MISWLICFILIFSQELADIHTKFLDKLRESLLLNAKMKMSQVFLEFREPFLIYGEYCSCLLGAIDYLGDVCKKNQIIEKLVQVNIQNI